MELRFDSRRDMVTAFETRFYVFHVDDSERMNADLRDLVLEHERTDSGVRRSNIGGWHSRDDLFEWEHRAIGALRTIANTAVRAMVPLMVRGACTFDFSLRGWANLSRFGAYNKQHTPGLGRLLRGFRNTARPGDAGERRLPVPRPAHPCGDVHTSRRDGRPGRERAAARRAADPVPELALPPDQSLPVCSAYEPSARNSCANKRWAARCVGNPTS